MTPTHTAMLSGSTSDQAPPRAAWSRRGSPAAGRATQSACIAVRATLAQPNQSTEGHRSQCSMRTPATLAGARTVKRRLLAGGVTRLHGDPRGRLPGGVLEPELHAEGQVLGRARRAVVALRAPVGRV